MKQIRKRLTYANVMSSIAVFLVLGGATAFAALAKNSVGTKQLKKNAVTTKKIKNNAVTTSKIKNNAVNGAKVDESTLGEVPLAAKATNADNATNAANAANANTVAGVTIRKFFFSSNEAPGRTTLLSLNGLTLQATCEGDTPDLIATTNAPALIHSGGTFLVAEPFYEEDDSFEPGDEFSLLDFEEEDSTQGTFTYAQRNGTVVTGVFESEEDGFEPSVDCVISGHVIG